MATRVLTSTVRNGRERGVGITDRDVQMMRTMLRWWCIGPGHLIRPHWPESMWHPDLRNEEEYRKWWKAQKHSVLRRIAILASVQDRPLCLSAKLYGQHMNPYAEEGVAIWGNKNTSDLVGSPWVNFPGGNLLRVPHAFASASVGQQMERMGLQILSERELARGFTVHQVPIEGGRLTSSTRTGFESGDDLGQRPDLAIVGRDNRYIAVEIERKSGRGSAVYRDKIRSYLSNERIAAVWYFTSDSVVLENVKRVYEDLRVGARPMPVRVMAMQETDGLARVKRELLSSKSASEDLPLAGLQPVVDAETGLVRVVATTKVEAHA